MNIYLHEIRSYRKFTLIWTLSLVALFSLYFSMYPTILKDADAFLKMMEAYPDELKMIMGLTESITSLLGYYAFTLSFVILCAAIQSMHIGLSIVSKERRNKTVDFLLTKPVNRTHILTKKILAGLTNLVLTNIVFMAIALILAEMVKSDSYDRQLFIKMTLSIFLVQVMFYAIGILLSIVLPKVKSVLTISLGVVFAFYFIGAMVVGSDDGDLLRFITPFKYFDPNFIFNEGLEWPFVLGATLLVIGLFSISYVSYQSKDIHAV